jgi:hypothetical protein
VTRSVVLLHHIQTKHLAFVANAISGAEVRNPFAQCSLVMMHDVITLVASNDVDSLREMNQHNVHSAFFDFCFGALGLIEKVLKVLAGFNACANRDLHLESSLTTSFLIFTTR